MHIVVEGNSGIGKKRFIELILETFSNVNSREYKRLNPIWNDPEDLSFMNACSFLLSRSIRISNEFISISNKSHLSFLGYIDTCLTTKYINKEKYEILKDFYNKVQFPKIDYLIVLKSSPGFCYEQLIKSKKNNTDPYFINEMNKTYEKLSTFTNPKTLTINIEDFDINEEISRNELIYLITKFIPELNKESSPTQWKTITRNKKKKSRLKLSKK